MTRVVQFMRDLVAKGMSWEDAADVGEVYEGGPFSPSPAGRPLYARAPRTEKYGPLQDPDLYDGDEKRRAFGAGLRFGEDAEPVSRLPEDEWWPLVGEVFRRDGYTCTYCGAKAPDYKLHCDHIVPVSRGGPNIIANLTTACEQCNCSKGAMLPHEWRPKWQRACP